MIQVAFNLWINQLPKYLYQRQDSHAHVLFLLRVIFSPHSGQRRSRCKYPKAETQMIKRTITARIKPATPERSPPSEKEKKQH
jgi:hypothetical protein